MSLNELKTNDLKRQSGPPPLTYYVKYCGLVNVNCQLAVSQTHCYLGNSRDSGLH